MAKNKNIFVTITGFKHYYGLEPFKIGNLIRCIKEPGNPYDSDAIRAFLPYIGKVGYIANSPQTKAGGTESASRIYERSSAPVSTDKSVLPVSGSAMPLSCAFLSTEQIRACAYCT